MTVTYQIKILDDKIKSNQVQHDLGREAAKLSALSSKDFFAKYEYLTGEDLGYKLNVFEKAKFAYFHWEWFWLIILKARRMKIW